jgi:aminopeptidase N
VLKQLVAAIGMDGFREGMRHYFRTHAYGNATLAQFLESLEMGSGVDLKEWARLWLETPSLNTIGTRLELDGDRIASLVLTQSAPAEYPTLRPHRLDVGLVRDAGGKLDVTVIPATIREAETEIPAARGLPAPSLVFPNYNDHGYAKVALDPESLAFVRGNMERIDDDLLRLQLWASLWNMVRDQQLKSTDYLALVRSKIVLEAMPEAVEAVTNNAIAAIGRYVPEAWRDREAHEFAQAAWKALKAATSNDLQIIWARALIAAASVPEDLDLIGRLADGTESVPGFTVDQDMRWNIAVKHVAYGMPGAATRVQAEAERDPSDRGVRAKLRAETSLPDATAKAAAWEKILGEGYGSLALTEAAMMGFNWAHQRELLAPYVGRFFDEVPEVFRNRDKEFATDFYRFLAPAYRVDRETLARGERLVASIGDELPVLVRTAREANDDLLRAIRCREYAAS